MCIPGGTPYGGRFILNPAVNSVSVIAVSPGCYYGSALWKSGRIPVFGPQKKAVRISIPAACVMSVDLLFIIRGRVIYIDANGYREDGFPACGFTDRDEPYPERKTSYSGRKYPAEIRNFLNS